MVTDKDIAQHEAPEGWALQSHRETFSGHAGPFYFRKEGAPAGVGFFSRSHHANMAGIVHGGALLTLADMALWDICRREIGVFKGVTVTLNAEFVGAGPVGAFIEATGEMVKSGRKMLFARGIVSAEGETLMSFSGTLKRLG
ncbi:MAG: thioesterase [Parvularcula sp.]|nr:thioesterase [Parvularcula sp.]